MGDSGVATSVHLHWHEGPRHRAGLCPFAMRLGQANTKIDLLSAN